MYSYPNHDNFKILLYFVDDNTLNVENEVSIVPRGWLKMLYT